MSVQITPASYSLAIFGVLIFSLAFFGFLMGSFLARKARGKYMAIGSAIYWTVYFINLYLINRYYYHRESLYQVPAIYALSGLLMFSGLLVLSLDITYIATYIVRRQR